MNTSNKIYITSRATPEMPAEVAEEMAKAETEYYNNHYNLRAFSTIEAYEGLNDDTNYILVVDENLEAGPQTLKQYRYLPCDEGLSEDLHTNQQGFGTHDQRTRILVGHRVSFEHDTVYLLQVVR